MMMNFHGTESDDRRGGELFNGVHRYALSHFVLEFEDLFFRRICIFHFFEFFYCLMYFFLFLLNSICFA